MKRIQSFLFVSMFLCVSTLWADTSPNAVRAHVKGHDPIVFLFEENPVISMPGQQFKIEAGEKTFVCERQEVEYLEMVEESAEGLQQTVSTLGICVASSSQGGITVSGLKPGTKVILYGTDGKVAGNAKATESGSVCLPSSASACILSIEGYPSIKIMNRK